MRKEKKAVLNASRKRAANAKALEDKLRKAPRKINVITLTTWPNKLKKQRIRILERTVHGHQRVLQQVPADRQANEGQKREPCHNSRGKVESWEEHFCELFNRPTTETPPDIHLAATDLPIDSNKQSKTDQGSNAAFKNGKVTVPDEIPAKTIKADT